MPFQKPAVIKYDNTLLYIEIKNTKIPLICSETELPLKPLIKKQKNIKAVVMFLHGLLKLIRIMLDL
jgi:hypothetical protein